MFSPLKIIIPIIIIKKIHNIFWSAEEGIGIRIEDDVLVGETENTILSAGFPKTPDEIEVLMAGK